MAISPDGRYMVYSLSDGEKESLRLSQVATLRDVEILAPDANGFHGLTFSRDGNYIYFVRSDKNDPVFKYLYAMPTLGGPARKLIADVDSPISFSPDGHQFVYERCVPARNEIELRVVDTDGGPERLLVTIPQGDVSLYQPGPAWSPDGKTIVVPVLLSGKQRRWLLNAVDMSTGTMRGLYSSVYDIGRPVWLAGGSAVLIPPLRPGLGSWTASDDLLSRRSCTPADKRSRRIRNGPRHCPRRGNGGGNHQKHDLQCVGGHYRQAFQRPPDYFRQFAIFSNVGYAADGKIFSTSTDGRLWVLNSNSKERTLVTDEAGWLTPCGPFVVFASYKGGTVTLKRANPDGSNATKLVENDLWKPSRTSLSTRAPACSPDGKFAFFVGTQDLEKSTVCPSEAAHPSRSPKLRVISSSAASASLPTEPFSPICTNDTAELLRRGGSSP